MKQTPPHLMSMIRELIAAPSVSSVSEEFDSSNMAVIELLSGWLEGMDFDVRIESIADKPHKANLTATIGPVTPESRGLLLSGHTDTVPYDAQFWNSDPFKLTEKDNRLYGLGTCDMKSFFALVIEALKGLDTKQFKQPLTILATADEESSMDGAKKLCAEDYAHVKYAVVGEPTGMKPVNAHKGIMMEGIRLIGHGGHSSNPDFGVNAIEAMHEVTGELMTWREELQANHRDERFTVPVPTLNLGFISGGDNPNRICEQCEIHFDLRALPGMALDELRGELNHRLDRLLKASPIKWEVFSLIDGTQPLHTDEDSPIVHSCESLAECRCHAVAFCTEGPYLSNMGIETVIMGPGEIDQAHQPDEYLALDYLDPTVAKLRKLIVEYCM